MEYKIRRTDRKLESAGSVLEFYRDTMILPDGTEQKWDYVRHKKGGGACTVPVLADGRILMIRQYRPAIDREALELPAGARDASGLRSAVRNVFLWSGGVVMLFLLVYGVAGVPLLLTSHSCSFRRMLLEDLADNSVTPQIALETSSKEILKEFAINELGVAFMPDMVIRDETDRHLLTRLNWTGRAFPVFARIFVHKDKHVNKAIRELVDMISKGV